MPCAGPGVNEQEIERAYEEIMALLKEKYKVQDCGPISVLTGRFSENYNKQREERNAALKAALRDLFVWQACEDF
jgi:hypothetical protein